MNPTIQDVSGNTAATPTISNYIPPQATSHPGLLQRLLPTIGGIGGGILGEVIDPFGGGLAGAALGAGLAGAGSAAGKVAENASDNSALGNGVLGAAAGGAVGQGAGSAVGGLLGKGASLLKDAGEASENAAVQKASDDAATGIYKAIPKDLRQAYDLNGSIEFAKNLGIDPTDPTNLTGAAGDALSVLNNSVNDALGQSGPVDASSYDDIIKNALTARGNTLGDYNPIAVSKGRLGTPSTPAGKLLGPLQDYGAGIATPNADSTAVRGLLQKVGNAMANATPKVTALTGAKDPAQVATHDALSEIYNNLKGVLYDRPEVADNFKALEGNLQASDVGGNQALADHLNNVLQGATNHQPVLDALQQFGSMNSLGKAAITAQKGLMPTLEDSEGSSGLGGKIFNGLVTGGHLGVGKAVALHILENAGKVAVGTGKAVGKAASAFPVVGAGLGSAIATGAPSPSPLQLDPNSLNMQGTTMQPSQSVNPFDALTNPGSGISANYSPIALQALAGMFDPNLLSQFSGNANAAEQNIQKAQTAAASVPNLLTEFQQAGSGQGLVGGTLSKLNGLLPGSAASNYNSQAAAEAEALSKATGTTITPQELPQLTQSNQTASDTIQRLMALLQTQGANTSNSVLGQATQ